MPVTEELTTLIGRQGSRLRVTGTLIDENGGAVAGSVIASTSVSIYDVDSGDMILEAADDETSGLTIGEDGAFLFIIRDEWMTIISTNLKHGAYERHRVLIQFEHDDDGYDFNLEFDVLVRKVKNLA